LSLSTTDPINADWYLKSHLQHLKDDILELRTRWSTIFVPSLTFDIQAIVSTGVTQDYIDKQRPASPIRAGIFIQPLLPLDYPLCHELGSHEMPDPLVINELDADEVILGDLLEDNQDNDPGMDLAFEQSPSLDAQIIWALPVSVYFIFLSLCET
jgi:hypothetical protein